MSPPGLWSAASGEALDGHVVVVHGSLDRSAGLLRLSRRLDDRCRVVRYDRRGYGRSAPHPGPFDMRHQVDDLVAVVVAEVPTRAHPLVIVGHSYGGNVALAVADRVPGLVDAVVTYESPLSWHDWWPHGVDVREWASDPEGAAEGFMRSLIGDDRWARLPPSARDARRREGAALVGELGDLRSRPPWDPDRIAVPVLAMHGSEARAHHRRAAETIASQVERGEVASIDGAGHFGPNTHPDEVAAVVTDFIARWR